MERVTSDMSENRSDRQRTRPSYIEARDSSGLLSSGKLNRRAAGAYRSNIHTWWGETAVCVNLKLFSKSN